MSKFEEAFGEAEVEETEETLRSKLLAKDRTIAEQRAHARALKKELDDANESAERLAAELSLYDRVWENKPNWLSAPKNDERHNGTLLVQFSDLHAGEYVNLDQMGGFNEYDLDICALRAKKFFERTIKLSRSFMSGVDYDGIVLVLGGDLVSGNIHDELDKSNLLTIYESIEFVIPLLKSGIEMFAEEYNKVFVPSMPGNHGRRVRKPEAKGYSADNADTHIARLLAQSFEGESNIEFLIPQSDDVDFTIYDWAFTASHGHQYKQSGQPEIGSIGPMARGTLRNLTAKTAEGKPFKYNLLHHFHQYLPAYTKGFSANGSIKGYDEYARREKFKPEPPIQALSMVTPEYGITGVHPIFVGDRDAEGW